MRDKEIIEIQKHYKQAIKLGVALEKKRKAWFKRTYFTPEDIETMKFGGGG